MNQLTKYCHYCGQEQCICTQGTTSSGTANPTPQPHAEDVKLAEEITVAMNWYDEDVPVLLIAIEKVTQPLRAANEALRERVTGLEQQLQWAQTEVASAANSMDAVANICKEQFAKLTAASEVIEKCGRALLPASWDDLDQAIIREQALATIKEWKDKL